MLHEEQKIGEIDTIVRYTGRGLEYHTALQIVEYFRKALADSGILGLSDYDMYEATKQALNDNVKCTGIALFIKDWLEGEFKPFKSNLMKVFGGSAIADQAGIEPEVRHYKKHDILLHTYDIIETFRQELAAFGWSSLRFHDVFQVARAGLKMKFCDDSAGEIDDVLRPIAWHIHVLLQEAQYAHLRPILEAGLRFTPDDVLQAAMKTVK